MCGGGSAIKQQLLETNKSNLGHIFVIGVSRYPSCSSKVLVLLWLSQNFILYLRKKPLVVSTKCNLKHALRVAIISPTST